MRIADMKTYRDANGSCLRAYKKAAHMTRSNAPRMYDTPTVTIKFSPRGLGISSSGSLFHSSFCPANGAMTAAICDGGTSFRSRIGDTRGF